MSEPLLIEINRTLSKPFFLERVSHDFAQTLVASLGEWAIWTEITDVVNSVATHPEDDVILSIAISAPADFLVTGDKQLLRLQRIGGCEIVGVAAFLSELGLRATEVATLENEPE